MRTVRGHHPARTFFGIERERDHAFFIQPEVAFENSLECRCARGQPLRYFAMTEARCDSCDGRASGIDIALHFSERYRRTRELAVAMKDRVEGILPALVGESARRFAQILDVAVTVTIAVVFDPLDRAPRVGPQVIGQREIAGYFDAAAIKPEKKRGRVDTAVVAAERDLTGRGHFAGANLVHYLSRLLVAGFVNPGALHARERLQGANRKLRLERQNRQRGD